MITLHWLYILAGLMFAAFAILSMTDPANPRRLGNAAFWGLMALSLLAGDLIGDFGNGLLVLGLAGLAGFVTTADGAVLTAVMLGPEEDLGRSPGLGSVAAGEMGSVPVPLEPSWAGSRSIVSIG